MPDFKYICPTERGAKRVTITKKQHKRLFKYDKVNWKTSYEYYLFNSTLKIEKFHSIWLRLILTLFFPIILLLGGIANKKMYKDFLKMWNQKKYGAYTDDYVYEHEDGLLREFKSIAKEYK